MPALIVLALLAVAIAGAWSARRRRTLGHPRWGILNLLGEAAAAEVAADRAALADLFPPPLESTGAVPACEVLFLYARFEADGSIRGSARRFRELVRASGAKVVVVAAENVPAHLIKGAADPRRRDRANVVFTLARRDGAFPRFFHALFASMRAGTPMPLAWHRLAPQVPGAAHADCPETIFLCELGGIRFAGAERRPAA